MSDTQRSLHDRNILDLIRNICQNGESGRLEILAGAIQGELSFKDGKLVDARVGHLTGFRAVNAAASMRDARISFDPAFTPIASSGITASERVVLKQFFGIETTDAYLEPATMSWPEETAQISDPEPVSEVADEVTLVRSNSGPSVLPPLPPRSRFSFPTAITAAALVIALTAATATAVLFNLRSMNAAAVSTAQSSAPVAAPVQQPEAGVVQATPVQATPVQATPTKSTPAQLTPAQSAPASPRVKQNSEPRMTARDLSGKWSIVNVIEKTSYRTFKDLKIGFDLLINQTGTSFTGSGRKISENGRTLPLNGRTPIQVTGTINGDRIEATFFEAGTVRKTNGKFVWRIDNAGRGLTGTFATTAARSKGRSAATKAL